MERAVIGESTDDMERAVTGESTEKYERKEYL